MDKLLALIDEVHTRLDEWRRQDLNEATTRRILVDRLLEALGWDIYDPSEVQYEFPTIDGRPVDYALKLNRRPVLLVEAKPLGDPLDDVKSQAQIVRYGAAQGVTWCILTNGVRWRIYRSIEAGPAPEKLMFEVSLDPKDSPQTAPAELAQRLRRFSREEMARGTLDALGEQTFTDGKVRKALQALMRQPPRRLLNLIREQIDDPALTSRRIRDSLVRLARSGVAEAAELTPAAPAPTEPGKRLPATPRGAGARRGPRRGKGIPHDEAHHTAGKPREVIELYRAIDRECLALGPERVGKRYLTYYISYDADGRSFCTLRLYQSVLRVRLHLKFQHVESPPAFARDVSKDRHWGSGDLELRISALEQIPEAARLIRESFRRRCGTPASAV